MANLAKSDMYDWRVNALMNWIEKNKETDKSLSMERLAKAGHLDQYHYLGLQSNDEVMRILGLDPSMKVLDVGCGIGGPARYISWKSGCAVTGVDIQECLVEAGNKVTSLVGLTDKVRLITGDVTQPLFSTETFDAVISLLVILHIEDRTALFSNIFTSLKAGGCFIIEDMVALDSCFNQEENRIAKEVIGAPSLPTLYQYHAHLSQVGFVDMHFESLTPVWVRWCIERSDQYEASKDEQILLHGNDVFMKRSSFYRDVKRLFLSGKLGGYRITGRKPSYFEARLKSYRASLHASLHTEAASLSAVRIIE